MDITKNKLSLDDPKVQAGLAALMRNSTSKGLATTGHANYYAEEWGKEAAGILDKLHSEKVPLKIFTKNISITTVRLRWYQGLKYLKDHLDPAGRYAVLSKATRCVTYDDYIELHIKLAATKQFVSAVTDWKEKLVAFIENQELKVGDKFNPMNVNLTDGEVQWINEQLDPLKELFLYKVTNTEILIVRYDNK